MPKEKARTYRSVWEAIEKDPIVALNLERRSNLLMNIQERIRKEKWTQAEVAQMLDTDQPRISNLMKGKINLFSLETLIGYLDKLGHPVKIEVGRPKKSRKLEHA
ncbi:helix-turn-helix domain-containing protein [Taklimakanibacter lacteus]|uniref:helix-turn-helix domain-containing protein n=1 Tax=Taklimakanibacter lacteus TaxID=2268456 RepID=UPI0034D40F1C